MAKKKEVVNSIIVRGIEILDNTVYEVVPKRPSNDAPDLYVKMGSEKHLNPNVSNLVSFVAVDGYWNTGFHTSSSVFREMGTRIEEAEILVEKYKDFILTPLVAFDKRYENLLDPSTDNTFLDDKNTNLYIGRQFNTKEPIQRFELFMAIIGGHIAPAGVRTKDEKEIGLVDENHHAFVYAQYALEAKDKVRSTEEKRATTKLEANAHLFNLLNKDKKHLVSLLNYVGIKASSEETNSQIITRASIWFDDIINCETFLDVVERSTEDPAFKEELKIVDVLRNERGLNYLEKAGREYLLNGVYLGTTETQIARVISKDADLLQAFYSKVIVK